MLKLSCSQPPRVIGRVQTRGERANRAVLSKDYKLAFIADTDAGLTIVDVADAWNPVVLGSTDVGEFCKGFAPC